MQGSKTAYCSVALTRRPAALQKTHAIAVCCLVHVIAGTSATVLGNLPLGLILVVGLQWLVTHFTVVPRQRRARPDAARQRVGWPRKRAIGAAATPFGGRLPAKGGAWRERVGSVALADAWERLCGAVVQTWVYDTWCAAKRALPQPSPASLANIVLLC